MRDKCEWPGVTPLPVFICTCFYCHTGPKLDLCVEHLSQHRLVAVDVEHVLNLSPACRCVRCVRRRRRPSLYTSLWYVYFLSVSHLEALSFAKA